MTLRLFLGFDRKCNGRITRSDGFVINGGDGRRNFGYIDWDGG